jgi:hypothetical protein
MIVALKNIPVLLVLLVALTTVFAAPVDSTSEKSKSKTFKQLLKSKPFGKGSSNRQSKRVSFRVLLLVNSTSPRQT